MATNLKGATSTVVPSKIKGLKPVLKGPSRSSTAACHRVRRISADKVADPVVKCSNRDLVTSGRVVNSRDHARNSKAPALAMVRATLADGALRKDHHTDTSEAMVRSRDHRTLEAGTAPNILSSAVGGTSKARHNLVANKDRWDLVSILSSVDKAHSRALPASIGVVITNTTVTTTGDRVRSNSVAAVNNTDLSSNSADRVPKAHPMARNIMSSVDINLRLRDRAIPANITSRVHILPWALLQVVTTFR